MLQFHKKRGETPLEMLDRLRVEQSELLNETLSYAGRLDPMAEGVMLVLVGDEENKNYKDYLGFDKTYRATFVCGVETDTRDILGLLTEQDDTVVVTQEECAKHVALWTNIHEQTYPWFSSQTVDGKKLFEHYREGNTQIERPKRQVTIHEANIIEAQHFSKEALQQYIEASLALVHEHNNLRQKEVTQSWVEYFTHTKRTAWHAYTVEIRVSTGTYIRALTETFPFPATVLQLVRTHIAC